MTENLGKLVVSRETSDRLKAYAALLQKWNSRINLVSRNSLTDLWTRHFIDSAQLFALADNPPHWVDIGSGGGFPGLVVAILADEFNPAQKTTLIQSDKRKATFLRTVIRETGIACSVLAQRIEQAEPLNATLLSARALADLPTLLDYADRHLTTDGTALFPKGTTWKKEVDAARGQWSFTLDAITSWTEPNAAILKIKGIKRV